MADKIAGSLRLATAATIVLALIAAGYLNRSPWIVILAAPLLTILYALGKWLQWQTAWRLGGMKAVARAFLITLPIQAVLAGFFYLVGLGLARLFAEPAPIEPLGLGDVVAAAAVFLIGVVSALLISRLEDRDQSSLAALREAAGAVVPPSQGAQKAEVELDIDPTPLSAETFFVGRATGAPTSYATHWRAAAG